MVLFLSQSEAYWRLYHYTIFAFARSSIIDIWEGPKYAFHKSHSSWFVVNRKSWLIFSILLVLTKSSLAVSYQQKKSQGCSVKRGCFANFTWKHLRVSFLALPWWRFLSYRNHSIDLQKANQCTGLYMVGNSAMKKLIKLQDEACNFC